MMNIIAKAQIDIAAPATEVWHALTDPESIAKYFFGSQVETDWKPGSPITWKGQYNGKSFEDKGEILEVERNRLPVLRAQRRQGLPAPDVLRDPRGRAPHMRGVSTTSTRH